jgi:hypothetical protein
MQVRHTGAGVHAQQLQVGQALFHFFMSGAHSACVHACWQLHAACEGRRAGTTAAGGAGQRPFNFFMSGAHFACVRAQRAGAAMACGMQA